MSKCVAHYKLLAKQVTRGYFAPLVGAVRGIRDEYRRCAALEKAENEAFEREWAEKELSATER